MRYIFCCLLFIVLSSCQSKPDPSIPRASMFAVKVEMPEDLRAFEVYEAIGTLINNSDKSWEILHGANMFTFDVFDKKGELIIKDILQEVDGVDIVHTIKPKDSYRYGGGADESRDYEYQFNEFLLPIGSNTIVATAKFTIKHDGKNFEFEIPSEPLKISVETGQ